jgi:hypothetical protein
VEGHAALIYNIITVIARGCPEATNDVNSVRNRKSNLKVKKEVKQAATKVKSPRANFSKI